MPPRTAHFRMADRVLDGQLEATLRRLYLETGSWEDVSRRLFAEYQIVVVGQTLRRWAKQLGIEEPTQAAS